MLQTWVNGETLETALSTLSLDKQYKLGVEAGRILKKIHSFKPMVIYDWYAVRFEKYLSNYEKYKQYGLKYRYERQINDYIKSNVHLLKGKWNCQIWFSPETRNSDEYLFLNPPPGEVKGKVEIF